MVKPLPAALRSRLQQHRNDQIRLSGDFRDQDFDYMDVAASSDSLNVASEAHRRTNENDDYAFLDEDLLTDEDDDDVKESLQRNYRNNNPKKNSNRNFDSNNNRQSRRQNTGANSWRRRGKRSVLDDTTDTNEDDSLDPEREKLDPTLINSEYHIVYKRKDGHMDHSSDYRKKHLL